MTDRLTTLTLETSISLIALLRAGPENIRAPLLEFLRIKSQPDLQIVIRKLKWAAIVSGVIAINRVLNHLSRNKWVLVSKTKWDWPNEVAVVTGGSSGIGACVVKGLAEKGLKVAVVDLVEPTQFASCELHILIYDDYEKTC
jgi:3-oxoacyl-ACP reductase-like protein